MPQMAAMPDFRMYLLDNTGSSLSDRSDGFSGTLAGKAGLQDLLRGPAGYFQLTTSASSPSPPGAPSRPREYKSYSP